VGGAASLVTTVSDGGFDPVPVQARTNDSIEVVVEDAGGATIAVIGLVVAARRPPIVVRTDPPRKKNDVRLNSAIVVVFSEPIDVRTLTGGSSSCGKVRHPLLGSSSSETLSTSGRHSCPPRPSSPRRHTSSL